MIGDVVWHLELAGSVTLFNAERLPVHITSRKALELLVFLAVRRSPVVDRDTIVDALWPEIDQQSARNRLKQTLSVLRREVPDIPILAHGKNDLELVQSAMTVDLTSVRERMRWVRSLTGRDRASAVGALKQILERDLLPGFSTSWAVAEQSQWARWRESLAQETLAQPGPFRFVDALPGTLVELVGREKELANARAWLTEGTKRWMALVGPPGVGKSRLAMEVINDDPLRYDAVLALSTTQTYEAHWTERLGQALGLQSEANVTERVVNLLSAFRAPLLVLDDFDQASPEMKRWAETIAGRVPHLRVLVTARVIPSDPRFEIISIAPIDREEDRQKLFALFAEKQGVLPHTLSSQSEAIAALSERLEGLPLAIEIASGWLRHLSAQYLSSRIESRPDYVIGRSSGGRASLADCVAKLVDNLTPESREALRFLSVCHGACGEWLATEALGEDWPWHVRSLVESSLAYTVNGITGPRHMVLQAIRDTVRMSLSPEDLNSVRRRHTDACVELSKRTYREFCNGNRRPSLDWVRDEGDNLILAYRRCVKEPLLHAEHLVHIERMGGHFTLIGRYPQFGAVRTKLRSAAITLMEELPLSVRLSVAGYRIFDLEESGLTDEAEAFLRKSVDEATKLNSPDVLANLYDTANHLYWYRGDLQKALTYTLAAAEQFELAGLPGPALWIQAYAASFERSLGRVAESEQRIERSRMRAQQIGDDNTLGMYDKERARDRLAAGQVAEALVLARSAVEAFKRGGEMVTLGDAWITLGEAHLANQDLMQAESAYLEAAECTPSEYTELSRRLASLRASIDNYRSLDIR